MAFGLAHSGPADFADIVKFDANAGRLFKVDYDPATNEKAAIDITSPPPRFAADFGSLEVGYGYFGATGPEFLLAPEGSKVYGKVLDGLREWRSQSNAVLESLEDLYCKFLAAPEAAEGKIPLVELTKTVPVVYGRGQRQRTVYTPCFTIIGWTERPPDLGQRTVPAPKPNGGGAVGGGSAVDELNDVIPFGPCVD
jgi:hypothetical protein